MKHIPVSCIPMSLRDDKKDSGFDFSALGYGNFYPWFLADRNPATVDDYFNVVLDMLSEIDITIEKEEYWFFRGDVNIMMMWLRVRHSF